jgi:hypothetical protein
MTTRWCPECGTAYDESIAACPECREVLTSEPPADEEAGTPVVIHRVPDAAAGALLCGVLEHQGIPAILRSATVPGYGAVRRDWGTSAWGEILVPRTAAADARGLIADYLQALERGGAVRDEDVEDAGPS